MKFKTTLRLALGLASLGCASPLTASTITYHFDVDTAALVGNPDAPFGLDFQMSDGDGVPNNSSAILNNFNFYGGNGVGTPSLFGGASGSLSTSVILSDSDFINDFFQEFTPGGKLSFDLSLTSSATGLTPDGFGFGIEGTSFFDFLTTIEMANGTQSVLTFPVQGVTASVHVPDSGGRAILPIGLAALGLFSFLTWERVKKLNA